MLSPIYPPILTLLVGVISFSMITNHKQTCIIHFVDCRKALHPYFTHHTRKYFGCERRRGLHGGGHVVARVDVLGTTCAAGRPLGLASGKLPSAHIASYEKGRCCQAPPCGETEAILTSAHPVTKVSSITFSLGCVNNSIVKGQFVLPSLEISRNLKTTRYAFRIDLIYLKLQSNTVILKPDITAWFDGFHDEPLYRLVNRGPVVRLLKAPFVREIFAFAEVPVKSV